MADQSERAAKEAQAKSRFLTIQAARLAGVITVMLGLAIVGEVIPISHYIGYALVLIGLVETLVTPVILAKMWSTKSAAKKAYKDAQKTSGHKK